jgi:hypothetical protein
MHTGRRVLVTLRCPCAPESKAARAGLALRAIQRLLIGFALAIRHPWRRRFHHRVGFAFAFAIGRSRRQAWVQNRHAQQHRYTEFQYRYHMFFAQLEPNPSSPFGLTVGIHRHVFSYPKYRTASYGQKPY